MVLRLLRLKRHLGVNFPKEKRGLPLNSFQIHTKIKA
nr:MAG TPA: hypothetical protein [Caudoviricetes sp.]